MNGIELIATERARQMQVEGWTAEHDDSHTKGEMASAATVYAWVASNQAVDGPVALAPSLWPWDYNWYKPSSDPIRNLVKAGALIAAEIDRIQRLGAKKNDSALTESAAKDAELETLRARVEDLKRIGNIKSEQVIAFKNRAESAESRLRAVSEALDEKRPEGVGWIEFTDGVFAKLRAIVDGK